MSNPTKSAAITAISDAINAAVSNTGEMTDQECRDAYNATLTAIVTVDPVKGKPTVKF